MIPRALALALALTLALPPLAHAQGETVTLPSGGLLTSRLRRMSDVNGVACAADRAYARSWSGGVAAWDGTGWHELPEPPDYTTGRTYGHAIVVTPSGVAIEASGRLAIWDGSSWSIATRAGSSPYDGLGGIAAVGDDVYAVGRGWIGRHEGASITSYDAGTWRDLGAVAGTSPADLWTAGQGGTLMHWDGRTWTRTASGTSAQLGGLVAGATNDVWAWSAAHTTPALLHFDGHAWSSVPLPLGNDLRSVALSGARVFATTEAGVFERAEGTWRSALTTFDFPDGQRELLAACATRTHLVVAAGLGSVIVRAL